MKNFIYFFALVILVGCQTTSNLEVQSQMFQVDGKALIRNVKTNENQLVNIDALVSKPEKLRIEVSTSIGIHLASIVFNKQLVVAKVPNQKKQYEGNLTSMNLAPLLKVKASPNLLLSAFTEMPQSTWACESENGEIKKCTSPLKESVSWSASKDSGKLIKIIGNDFEIQINIKNLKNKKSFSESDFLMPLEKGYSLHKI